MLLLQAYTHTHTHPNYLSIYVISMNDWGRGGSIFFRKTPLTCLGRRRRPSPASAASRRDLFVYWNNVWVISVVVRSSWRLPARWQDNDGLCWNMTTKIEYYARESLRAEWVRVPCLRPLLEHGYARYCSQNLTICPRIRIFYILCIFWECFKNSVFFILFYFFFILCKILQCWIFGLFSESPIHAWNVFLKMPFSLFCIISFVMSNTISMLNCLVFCTLIVFLTFYCGSFSSMRGPIDSLKTSFHLK